MVDIHGMGNVGRSDVGHTRGGGADGSPRGQFCRCLSMCAWLIAAAISCEDEGEYQEFEVESLSFLDGETIPLRHTCDGGDISPPLTFYGYPEKTESFAIIMDVPEEETAPFVHWVMWGISASSNFLSQDQNLETRAGAFLGTNSAGTLGYFGPCPVRGNSHLFTIRVYALDKMIDLAEGSGRAHLERAMEGHIVGLGKLTGRYAR